MAAHLSNGAKTPSSATSATSSSAGTKTLSQLPKSSVFTQNLPADSEYPTPQDSDAAPREDLGPRMVRGALYTYVRPERVTDPELLGVSPAALRDLDISPEAAKSKEFLAALSGNQVLGWDADKKEGEVYPWAQCYGGYQFGQWAGQLGDGRAISLFETTNELTGVRYEVQLKGAGRTPYSRFADGKAVLRSSIREFIVSEALNALRIPTTRALSLTLTPNARVQRERTEPGAIVSRFAQSWIRIGTFDLLRARGDRKNLRRLADYVAEHVYGGWDELPGAVTSSAPAQNDAIASGAGDKKGEDEAPKSETIDPALLHDPPRSIPRDEIEHSGPHAQNRYTRLYRAICRANAATVAKWQTYAFTNGVLNTDNTSILGLSVDFGPFAFLDNFDPSYTPNHDDHMLRYSYKNQPSIIWWNLVRLGEALGELMGAGSWVDDVEFAEKGVREDRAKELVSRGETLITQTGEEYKAIFMAEYKKGMAARLGLKDVKEGDFEDLYSELLDSMEALELDFNQFFRKLSHFRVQELNSEDSRKEKAEVFFRKEGETGTPSQDGRIRLAKWLERWRSRVTEDWGEDGDEGRIAAMLTVNPKFIPKSWILDELIDRVEKKGEREVLQRVMQMALYPFNEEWGLDKAEEERFCGDVPKYKVAMQCSCSS